MALLVGAIGIANVMLIDVLERRTEIGLRRALGVAVTGTVAAARGWAATVPPVALWAGLATAVAIGAVAGLYPAARAARLTPTDALRTF